MLVQPQLERRAHVARDQPQRVAAVQPFLDLALELRVEHLGREDEAGAREHVFGHQLDALGQQAVQVDETLDGAEQAVLEPGLMRAAGHRGDQVDVTFAQRVALVGEGHAPARALAFGVVLGFLRGGVLRAFEQRDQRLGRQALHQVVAQAALVEPALQLGLFLARLLLRQHHRHAGHQHGLAAQQVHEVGARQLGALEIFRIRPDAHAGTVAALAGCRLAQRQRLDDVAATEGQRRHLPVAPHRDPQAPGQRVGHADADAVQAAAEAVGAAGALVELATGVQAREDDLEHRHPFFGVQSEGDAAAVVVDAHRAVGVQGDGDLPADAGQRFVGGVVQHLLHDVQRVVGAGVHARSLLDRLQALEDADRGFGVGG